jgi:hypothetical protein
MATLARREAPLERGKGGDDASWTNVNLIGTKNEENSSGPFNCYK